MNLGPGPTKPPCPFSPQINGPPGPQSLGPPTNGMQVCLFILIYQKNTMFIRNYKYTHLTPVFSTVQYPLRFLYLPTQIQMDIMNLPKNRGKI